MTDDCPLQASPFGPVLSFSLPFCLSPFLSRCPFYFFSFSRYLLNILLLFFFLFRFASHYFLLFLLISLPFSFPFFSLSFISLFRFLFIFFSFPTSFSFSFFFCLCDRWCSRQTGIFGSARRSICGFPHKNRRFFLWPNRFCS